MANRRKTSGIAVAVFVVIAFVLNALGGGVSLASSTHVASTLSTPTYSVTFMETGLTTGASWTVVLNGTVDTTTSNTVTFQEASGTYSYLIHGPSNYRVSGMTPSGSLTVSGKAVSESVTFARGTTYTITFSKTGLATGSNWCVALGGWSVCAKTTTIKYLYLTPGTYSYSIPARAGFVITAKQGTTSIPLSGTLTLSTRAITVAVTYVFQYTVTFTESGLATGTSWSVTLGTSTMYSTGTQIVFSEGNGSYAYKVGAIAGYTVSPHSGTARVSGANVNVALTFTRVTYTVTFTEAGLPSGTSWTVTLAGTPHASTTTTVTFTEPNGTYGYTVTPIAGYSVSPSSGSITVNGAAVGVKVTFTLVTYPVTFTESGLPSGTSWSVTLGGKLGSSTTPSIAFSDPNGTYAYAVTPVAGYTVSPGSGSVTVNGGSATVSVTFTAIPPKTYSVIFTESGLATGTGWSVTLNSQLLSSVGSGIEFVETNGTYTYTVTPVPGYTVSPRSGSVMVSGHDANVAITFTQVTYTLTFTETGLPSGTPWSVTLNGNLESSIGSQIAFVVPNGTYPFTVTPIAGYTVSPNASSVTVNGGALSVGVVFTQVTYFVQFNESGLPTGTSWSLTLGETLGSSTGAAISFTEPNGTFGFAVTPIAGYTVLPDSGSVVVNGANQTVALNFTVVTYAVAFNETGLSTGTPWEVYLTVSESNSSTGTSIGFVEPNGTYTYSLISGDPSYSAPGGSFSVAGSAVTVLVAFSELFASPSATVNPVDSGQYTTFSAHPSGGSGAYSSYAWSGLPSGCTGIGNVESFSCAPSATGTYTVEVAVTDSNDGYQTGSFVLIVDAAPTESAPIAAPSSVDVGQTVTFTAVVSGGSGGGSYAWSFGSLTGCEPSTSSMLTCMPIADGTFPVSFNWTDSNGIAATGGTPLLFTVYTDPTVSTPVANVTSSDVGQGVTIATTVGGGSGGYSLQWTGLPSGCASTIASFSCAPDTAGTYTISVTVTDSNGFVNASGTLTFTVYADPTVSTPVANVSSSDVGQSVTFTTTVGGGSGGYALEWTGLPLVCASTAASFSCVPDTAGTYSVNVSVTDSNGFVVTSATLSFTVFLDPTISTPVGNVTSSDVGQSVTFTTTVGGGSGGYSLQWTGLPSGCASMAASFSCAPDTAGTYTISVTVTDSNGFVSTSGALLFTVYADPTVSTPVGNVTSSDVGQSVTFTTTVGGGSGGYSLQWTGLPSGCASMAASFSCAPDTAGTYTISVTVTDSNGFVVTSDALTFTVYADPTIATPVANVSSADVGQSATFTVSAGGGSGGLSYVWYGLPDGCSGSMAIVVCTPTAAVDGASITVMLTDSNGYMATSGALSFTVYSDPTVSAPGASVSSADVGQSVTFTVSAGGGSGGLSYAWFGLPDGCSGSMATVACAPTAAVAGGSITVVVTDSNGFSVTSGALTFTVYTDPSVSTPVASPTSVFTGESVTFTTSASGGSGGYVLQWLGLPSGCASTLASFSCAPTAAGPYTITVSVIDTNGFVNYSDVLHFYVNAGLAVVFQETGLPTGTAWSVSLNSVVQSTTTNVIAFAEPNGSFSYVIEVPSGYLATPSSGSVTVSGSTVTVPVRFTLVQNSIEFTAGQLPTGKSWTVVLNGTAVTGTQPSVTFTEPDGTYAFLIVGPSGRDVVGIAASGELVVTGSMHLSFLFQKGKTYSITFHESGLPKGEKWCVSLEGWKVCSTKGTLKYGNLTPGTYAYAVLPMTGQTITAKISGSPASLSGDLTVTGRSYSVALKYVYPYSVTFTESGLPAGTSWSVTVKGVTEYSTSSTIAFQLPNGTYSYKVGLETGYTYKKSPGSVPVKGGPATALVTFAAKKGSLPAVAVSGASAVRSAAIPTGVPISTLATFGLASSVLGLLGCAFRLGRTRRE